MGRRADLGCEFCAAENETANATMESRGMAFPVVEETRRAAFLRKRSEQIFIAAEGSPVADYPLALPGLEARMAFAVPARLPLWLRATTHLQSPPLCNARWPGRVLGRPAHHLSDQEFFPNRYVTKR